MNIKAYLHDLVKAVLIYNPEEAFKEIRKAGVKVNFLDKDIVFTRGEPKGNKNYFDVFVAISYVKPDKYGNEHIVCQMLFIEVKTGKYNEKWLDQLETLYKDRKQAYLNLFTTFEYDYKEKRQVAKFHDILGYKIKDKYKNYNLKSDLISAHKRLVLICPESEIPKVEKGLRERNFNHGTHFQIYPIEPIYKIIKEKMAELNNLLQNL